MIVKKEILLKTLAAVEVMLHAELSANNVKKGDMFVDVADPPPNGPALCQAFQEVDDQALTDIRAIMAYLSSSDTGDKQPSSYVIEDKEIASLGAYHMRCVMQLGNGNTALACHEASMFVTAMCRATQIDLDDVRARYAAQRSNLASDPSPPGMKA